MKFPQTILVLHMKPFSFAIAIRHCLFLLTSYSPWPRSAGIGQQKIISHQLHCPKSNTIFRDISRNVEENEILHEIFRLVSCFPSYISRYI